MRGIDDVEGVSGTDWVFNFVTELVVSLFDNEEITTEEELRGREIGMGDDVGVLSLMLLGGCDKVLAIESSFCEFDGIGEVNSGGSTAAESGGGGGGDVRGGDANLYPLYARFRASRVSWAESERIR